LRIGSAFYSLRLRATGEHSGTGMKLPITLVAVLLLAAHALCADVPPEIAAAKARYKTSLAAGDKTARDQYQQDLQKLKNGTKAKKNKTFADAVDAELKALSTEQKTKGKKDPNALPYGKWVPGQPGFVTSPYEPYKGFIDVHTYPPGSQVICPYSMKPFLVPEVPK